MDSFWRNLEEGRGNRIALKRLKYYRKGVSGQFEGPKRGAVYAIEEFCDQLMALSAPGCSWFFGWNSSPDSSEEVGRIAVRVCNRNILEARMANYPQTTTTEFSGDITLTSSGKVGVGTASPATKLEVVASAGHCLKAKGTGSNWAGMFYDSDESQEVLIANGTHAATFMGGNVGIGTDSPQSKLDISGKIMISDSTSPATPATGVIIYFDGTNLKARRLDGKTSTLSTSWA